MDLFRSFINNRKRGLPEQSPVEHLFELREYLISPNEHFQRLFNFEVLSCGA